MTNLISNVTQSPYITEEDKYVMDTSFPCPADAGYKCNYNYPENNKPPTIPGYNGSNSCSSTPPINGNCVGIPTRYVSSNPKASVITITTNGIPTIINPIPNIINDYMNFMPLKGLVNMSNTSNNTLKLCDYLSRFSQDNCNACIIGYVDQLGIFRTLNYDFFGVSPDKSNLILQTDIMNNKLNSENGIINYYRNNYTTKINGIDYANTTSLKFTNCLQFSSNYTDPNTMINNTSTCYNTLTNYKNQYIPIQDNLDLYPLIWQINSSSSTNILNSCGVYINSFPDYKVSQKFIEYDDQLIYLSPNSGGLNQQLLFDNVNIIRDIPASGTKSVILTTNIKTLNNLYLLPSVDKGFSVNTNTVKLESMPDPKGKWLIIGFNLSNFIWITSKYLKIAFWFLTITIFVFWFII